MFLHTFLVTLGLAASVSATAHPRDDAPVPELIATPSNYSNATVRQGLVDSRSLETRQYYCNAGYHACSDRGCCENTEYCVTVQGQLGCCPNGRVCTGPPQGPPTCIDAGYYLCPSQEFCCPYGADCKRDLNNNPKCEWSSSPPPPTTKTSTSTYEYWTTSDYETSTYETSTYKTTSTSAYSYSTPTITTSSPYTSFPHLPSTTTNGTTSSSRDNDNFSIANVNATTSPESSNGPPLLSSAERTTLGYTVTGIMFLLVAVGLVQPHI